MNPAVQFRAEQGSRETAEGTMWGKAKVGGRTQCKPLAPWLFLLGLSRKAGPFGTLDSAPSSRAKGLFTLKAGNAVSERPYPLKGFLHCWEASSEKFRTGVSLRLTRN